MKDDYPQDIQKSFNRWAPIYNLVTVCARGIREKVFDFTCPEKEAKILDVCTGTGKQAFAFGKRGFDVTGVDFSEEMLRIAVRKNRYDNVRFAIGDAENLPFKKNRFDVSCISFGLHEMPELVRKKVIGELVRVTKPHGKIIMVDYALPKEEIKRFLFYHFVRFYESKYFPEFIKTNLQEMIHGTGLKFNASCEYAFGCVKIWKYEKV